LGNYTFYKIVWNDKEAGYASYRFISPYWYIDWFLIDEQYRRKGCGTELLKYITQQMWNEERISIRIHPGAREDLINFLVKNNFSEDSHGNYFLHPN
jgi:GNAT superfamily N-acetyltransferase